MKLYHGTTGRHLPAILRYGLQPRGKRRGNWSHTTESSPYHVYMTDSYAPFFAMQACWAEAPDTCLVLEIDSDRLDVFKLTPDEDALLQTHAEPEPPSAASMTAKQRTRWYRDRLDNWADCVSWLSSVKTLGTCAYSGTIPPSAITRYAMWPHHLNRGLYLTFDLQVTPINQFTCGDRYRLLTAQLFGDVVLPPLPPPTLDEPAERLLDRFNRPRLPLIQNLIVQPHNLEAA